MRGLSRNPRHTVVVAVFGAAQFVSRRVVNHFDLLLLIVFLLRQKRELSYNSVYRPEALTC